MASNESVAAELRKLVEKWRNQSVRTNEAKYQDGDFLECSKELEPLIARLEAPPNHDAEENLADYLLRTSPPDWNYEQILRLAKSIAIGDYLLRTSLTDWNYKKILRLAKQVGKERL